MTALESALRQICADLTESGHSFALVGGLAVSARTEPRFTRDADIAVAVATDAEAEALVRHLRSTGYEVEAVGGIERLVLSMTLTRRDPADRGRPHLDLDADVRLTTRAGEDSCRPGLHARRWKRQTPRACLQDCR